MFFLSKAITLLRPSLSEGWPIGHIYPILSFSESVMKKQWIFFRGKIQFNTRTTRTLEIYSAGSSYSPK